MNANHEASDTKQSSMINQLRSLASDMFNSLSISRREQPETTQICWGKHDFKRFTDLDDDLLYQVAMVIATIGKTKPRELYNNNPEIAAGLGYEDVPYQWLSPDLWRFRLLSRACAAAGRSAWLNLCLPTKQNKFTRRDFYYRKLHLPPRCGNLGILKRILCDNGLGKIVTEVVYHAHPLYTDERLEETLRSVLNQDLTIIERISNTKTPNMGADLMTKQQREQESFFKQLSQPEGHEYPTAILGPLNPGVKFVVKSEKGLGVDWLSSIDRQLPGVYHAASTPFAGLAVALMAAEQVEFDAPCSTFFNIGMTTGLHILETLNRSLELEEALRRITDLKLTDIRLLDVGQPGSSSFANAEQAVNNYNNFLGDTMMSLKSLEIGFDWRVYDLQPTSGYFRYADMLLNGMLANLWMSALKSVRIEGATSSADGLVTFIKFCPSLERFDSMRLRLKDECEALKFLKVLRHTRWMDWRLMMITLYLDDKLPHTNGELQSLGKELIEVGGAFLRVV